MEFVHEFAIPAEVKKAWPMLLDLERIVPCVPGAAITEMNGTDACTVRMRFRVGPMKMNYQGDVHISEVDNESHSALMAVQGQEVKGPGTVSAKARLTVRPNETESAARVVTELRMTGRVASMGRGLLEDVAGQIIESFAENLAEVAAGQQRRADGSGGSSQGQSGLPSTDVVQPEGREESPGDTAEPDTLDLGAITGRAIVRGMSQQKVLIGSLVITGALCILIGFALGRAV